MGKQIRFFMGPSDERIFTDVLSGTGSKLVLNNATPILINATQGLGIVDTCYAVFPESRLVTSQSGFIDPVTSDAIEFSRSRIKDNRMMYGRLWVETWYYDEDGNKVQKDKWLSNKFNTLCKWVKSKYVQSACKD